MKDVKIIREAICANRGGHENTDDAGIMLLWKALDDETRQKYLDSVSVKRPAKAGKKAD